MKFKLFFILLTVSLFLIYCKDSAENQPDWIVGKWLRENDSKGQTTYENWLKLSENEYIGNGFTLQNKDTIFSEKLRLIKDSKIWKLEVIGVNENPTYFTFTKQTKTSFTCESIKNEFPKKIIYKYVNTKLVAEISDDTKKIQFKFKTNN